MVNVLEGAGLTGIVIIDIAIGIIFAVLTFSLVATALQEAIAGVLNYRGEHLRKGIALMLRDTGLTQAVLNHPLIESLKGPQSWIQKLFSFLLMWGRGWTETWSGTTRLPSSIPKATFARALVEALIDPKISLAETIEGGVDEAAGTLATRIDGLALDKRLKTRLKAVLSNVDFDGMKGDIQDGLDTVGGQAKTLAEELGASLRDLGVEETIIDRVRDRIAKLDLFGKADALTREIEAAVDGVDVERTLRDHAKAVLAHIDLDGIEARVEATVESVSARAEAAIENAIDRVEAELADWFDSAMDRVTGWYVRRAKTMLFLIGFGLAATLNFDLIGYGKQLAADDALRSAMVQQAQASAATGQIGGFAVPDASEAGTPQEQNEGETENVVDANGDGEITDAEAQKAAADLRAA
ncbi:MAG: HPF/RaiA family ribosome-associated protein, partial [Pseudomonadota bacterium]